MKTIAAIFALLACAAFGDPETPVTRVDFASQPEGATVLIDGQSRGVTPLTLFDVRPGRHFLRLRLAGYCDHSAYFTVEDGIPLQQSATLAPEKGLLLIRSEPSECEISLEGVTLGTTPKLITTLNSKDVHRITLRKAGYRSSSFDVRFQGRTPLVREETLILNSAIVDVTSEPSGAEVTVNGIVRGTTPCTVTDVPNGRATVRLRLDGFSEEVRELSVNAGDRQTLSLVLKGLPGTLGLVSLPEGARFYVNDEFRGKSPLTIPNLAPGDYTVRAELAGYGTETRTVTLANGATAREEFRLSNTMGRLEIRSAPVGAQVLLDGKVVGTTRSKDPGAEQSDPLMVPDVLEGEHTVVLKLDGYADAVRHPQVKSEETLQLGVRLKRIFTPDVEVVTDTGTHRGVLVSNTPEAIVIEVKMGINRTFPREGVRKLTFLNAPQP